MSLLQVGVFSNRSRPQDLVFSLDILSGFPVFRTTLVKGMQLQHVSKSQNTPHSGQFTPCPFITVDAGKY